MTTTIDHDEMVLAILEDELSGPPQENFTVETFEIIAGAIPLFLSSRDDDEELDPANFVHWLSKLLEG